MNRDNEGIGARFALGTYALTGAYGQVDAHNLVEEFVDLGGRYIDTAALYGNGQSELLVGRAIKHVRDQVIVCTKGGFAFDPARGTRYVDGHPEAIKRHCEESLARLGIEQIDLYYLHRMDPQVPIEESVGALHRLREQGKVRAIGLCEVGESILHRAYKAAPLDALQSEYSLATREPEKLFGLLAQYKTEFFAFSPLSRGLLSGALSFAQFEPGDDRAHLPRFLAENFTHNLDLVKRAKSLASEHALTTAQLALAWCAHKRAIVVSGATESAHLQDLQVAAQFWLTDELASELEALFASIRGERYSEEGMRRAAAGYATLKELSPKE